MNGILVSHTENRVSLPDSITPLYWDWKTSTAKTFSFFRKYADTFCNICVSDQVDDKFNFFISKSSINTCRERISYDAGRRQKAVIDYEFRDDPEEHLVKLRICSTTAHHTLSSI